MARNRFTSSLAGAAFSLLAGTGVAFADALKGAGDEAFSALETVTPAELGAAVGTGIDIGAVGVNLATNTGTVSDTTMIGSFENGQIGNNTISNIKGINSMMFNTGNNVNFQSNMQVNVFLQ